MTLLLRCSFLLALCLGLGAWIHGTGIGWHALKVGGGGFVTGMSISDDGATKVIRVDVYGAYVSVNNGAWVQMVTRTKIPVSVTASMDSGPQEVVVAPSNSARIYMLLQGRLLRSNDTGATFTETAFAAVDSGVSSGNSSAFRLGGPKMAVDPINPDVLYVGTSVNGLRVTLDGGSTWSQVSTVPPSLPQGTVVSIAASANTASGNVLTFTSVSGSVAAGQFVTDATNPFAIPAGTTVVSKTATTVTLSAAVTGSGVATSDSIGFSSVALGSTFPSYAIAFDRASGSTGGKTNGIYASAWGYQVYRSTNAGGSWAATSGGPTTNSRISIDQNGKVWFVSNVVDQTGGNTNLWTFNGTAWSRYTVSGLGSQANGLQTAAVNPANASNIVIADQQGILNVSSDAGVTWTGPMNGTVNFPTGAGFRVATDAPWLAQTLEGNLNTSMMIFDPVASNKLWNCEGLTTWWTNPPTTRVAFNWNSQTAGIENLVANNANSAPGVTTPVLGSWDRPLFKPVSLATYPSVQLPNNWQSIQMGWGVNWASSVPSTFVAVVTWNGQDSSGMSTDGGSTWSTFAASPYRNRPVTSTTAAASQAVITLTSIPDTVVTGMIVNYEGIFLTTNAPTAAGTKILHFASVPATITGSMGVTAPQVTRASGSGQGPFLGGDTVASVAGGDVTVSANLAQTLPAGSVVLFKQSGTAPIDNGNPPTVSSINRVAGTITLSSSLAGSGLLTGETISIYGNHGGGIAAATPNNILWLPSNQAKYPWYTKDGGVTWKNAILGTSGGFNADGSAINDPTYGTGYGFAYYLNNRQVAADRVDGTLYVYKSGNSGVSGGLYASTDGGDNWTLKFSGIIAGNAGGENNSLVAVPGNAGHLFMSGGVFATGGAPFQRSVDHGVTWVSVPGVTLVGAFGLGAIKSGKTYPSVYVYGTIAGVVSIYRSDDFTTSTAGTPTWTDLGLPLNTMDSIKCIEGDKNTWGLVYTCQSGTGWSYGHFNYLLKRDIDPAANDNTPVWVNRAA